MAFLLLLVLCSLTALVARRFRWPYTTALVIVGLSVSLLREQLFPAFDLGLHLTPELLFGLLLPPLVYEAAFHFELRAFLASWRSILALAAPGLLVGILAAGALVFGLLAPLGLGLPFGGALLLAAVLSATDPVAVIALLKELGTPGRMGAIMEGESLVNDGVAVVAFLVALVALGLDPVQAAPTAGWVARFLGWELLGAILVGGLVGLGASWLTSLIDDHLVEITLTTLAAFGSFLLADRLHASGVIACLTAGMLTGNVGARFGMSAASRVAVASFWEYAAFLANSLVFLLVGLESSVGRLLDAALPIVLVWLSLLVARAAVVYGSLPLLERWEGRLRRGKRLAIVWGGLRGGIAMVLALSIPRGYAHRDLIIDLVFGATLLTILVQGTTMGRLLAAFGLRTGAGGGRKAEDLHARLRSLQASRRALERELLTTRKEELRVRRDCGQLEPAAFRELSAGLDAQLERLEEDAAPSALTGPTSGG